MQRTDGVRSPPSSWRRRWFFEQHGGAACHSVSASRSHTLPACNSAAPGPARHACSRCVNSRSTRAPERLPAQNRSCRGALLHPTSTRDGVPAGLREPLLSGVRPEPRSCQGPPQRVRRCRRADGAFGVPGCAAAAQRAARRAATSHRSPCTHPPERAPFRSPNQAAKCPRGGDRRAGLRL